jgi:DNA gyrase subunit A
LVVLSSGKVVRSAVAEVPSKGRDTMGVVFARMTGKDRILAVARNSERGMDEDEEADAETSEPQTPNAETPEA